MKQNAAVARNYEEMGGRWSSVGSQGQRRRTAARPTRPVPRRARVEGSGVTVAGALIQGWEMTPLGPFLGKNFGYGEGAVVDGVAVMKLS